MDIAFDYQFRLILIGDSTVGKSSLLKYFTDGRFAEVSAINKKPSIIMRKQHNFPLHANVYEFD